MSARAGTDLPCAVCGALKYVPRRKLAHFRYCSTACMARARAEQMRGNQYAKGHAPNGTSFTAGLVPWNKGTRGVMQPNSGSFRDGEPSPKLVPDGSMRVRVDKQGKARNWIKVAGFWIPNARHVWEQHNGPLPSGKVIHHIDETGLNDAPENLTPLTREDHIRLHRPIAV